ncbi:hypothetical protein DFH29DRAFT_876056 [Suillus ampliporus]|nr:hypothetical protein DFH29DRAFT_876056 [Suillus ampliporus]
MTCHLTLLHYDTYKCRPNDDEGNKVLPSNFKKYHEERGRGAYTEVAVYPWKDKTADKTYWNPPASTPRRGMNLLHCSVMILLSRNPEEHKKPRPIQLEWTYWEQRELIEKLESAVGDGIAANEFHVLFRCCKHCLFKRSAKATTSVGVEIRLHYRGY